MKRVFLFLSLNVYTALCFAQASPELTEQCISALERCEAKINAYDEQVKRFEAYKQTCDEEVSLRENAHVFAKEAIAECKKTIELRELQITKLDKIETNLENNLNQCLEGYEKAMQDYKTCVQTSSFSFSKSKMFWIGLGLGLLIGLPIAI